MPQILIDNVNLGGIADSKYLGSQKSVSALVGLDIHSEPGIIKVNQKLTKESGTTVDDFVKIMFVASNGSTYLFGSTNGKIWERESSGTYTLRHTAAPAAGAVGITGAFEDQGYIYWITEKRIGRCATPAAGGAFAAPANDWATLTTSETAYHHAIQLNLINYFANGKYISQVESGVFTENGLDLKPGVRVKCLAPYVTELLAGSFITENSNETHCYRWNTWSLSFTADDLVPDNGINCFLPTDNYVLVQAGNKGNFYVYTNDRLEWQFRLPGDWLNKTALVHPGAAANFNNMPLFGLSNVSSNPALQGVYSYGRRDPKYPNVLNLEYVISPNKTASIEVGAICVVGSIILVSWKDGTTYGVDKLDTSLKYTAAYLESRLITIDRVNQTDAVIRACYRSLPAGTNITIKIKKDHAAAWSAALATKLDATRQFIETTNKIGAFTTLEVRVDFVVSSNDAPELERVEIDL